MIQRIQSVYLLLAAVAMVATMFLPFANLVNAETNETIEVTTFSAMLVSGEVVEYMWPSFVLLIINILLTLAIIFLYKKRMLQIRLSIVSIFVFIGNVVLTSILAWMLSGNCEGYTVSVSAMATIPLFVIISIYMAIRAIGADEALVRSADRLRG